MDPPGVEPGPPPRQGGALPLGDEPDRAARRMDRRGVEPRSPACDTGVVPLDQQPDDGRIVPEGVEPPFPPCKRGVVAVGPRDVSAQRFFQWHGWDSNPQASDSQPDRYASSRTVPSDLADLETRRE